MPTDESSGKFQKLFQLCVFVVNANRRKISGRKKYCHFKNHRVINVIQQQPLSKHSGYHRLFEIQHHLSTYENQINHGPILRWSQCGRTSSCQIWKVRQAKSVWDTDSKQKNICFSFDILAWLPDFSTQITNRDGYVTWKLQVTYVWFSNSHVTYLRITLTPISNK